MNNRDDHDIDQLSTMFVEDQAEVTYNSAYVSNLLKSIAAVQNQFIKQVCTTFKTKVEEALNYHITIIEEQISDGAEGSDTLYLYEEYRDEKINQMETIIKELGGN